MLQRLGRRHAAAQTREDQHRRRRVPRHRLGRPTFTTALSQAQEIADTNRAAVEGAIEQYLGIPKETAAFISLPTFPLGVDAARLQRVVGAMTRFGLLPPGTTFRVTGMIGS